MGKKVLVIIVTYNGRAFIEKCLNSLCAEENGLEVMVIDNASEDETLAVTSEKFPFVHIFHSKRNKGFGAANNIGFRYAIGKGFKYVYLLNQDAWINGADILKLTDIADRNSKYGIISPFQVYADGFTPDKGFSNCFSQELKDLISTPQNVYNEIYPIKPHGMIQAAHWLVAVEALKKTGGFSPSFFHYGEDNNLCYRMRYHEYELGVVPGIKGIHDRQGRKMTKEKSRYISLQKWKNIVSDPNYNWREKGHFLKYELKKVLKKDKYHTLPMLLKFTLEIPKVLVNYKKARREGAFLGRNIEKERVEDSLKTPENS